MQRSIAFYRTADGKCPVAEFIDSQPAKVALKIAWVLKAVQELEQIPKTYFKKITGTDFYEVRIEQGGNIYRLLGFFSQRGTHYSDGRFSEKDAEASEN